jgi:hypothetical protein
MTKLLLSAVLLVGCAKANDVSRMEDEAIATAAAYGPTVHELDVRANDLLKVPLAPDAASRLRDAKAQIASLKGLIAGMTRAKLDEMQSNPDLIQKRNDNVQHDLREGIITATDHLEAVESWIAVAERTPGTPTQ